MNFCPKILTYNDEIVEIINLFTLYEKGMFYELGSYLDQPQWYIEAMIRLENLKAEYERELLEKNK